MKYSVIVPVYNGEKTIARCLDSLLDQHCGEAEILLINDGSTDATDAICRQYAEKNPVIRYFSKENGGVSSARNIGLKYAAGQYILFADCDDTASERSFAEIDRQLADDPTDLLVFSWTTVSADSSENAVLKNETVRGEAIAKWAEDAMRNGSFGSLWSKVFLADIIRKNGLLFNEALRIAEDWSFIFRYLLYVDSLRTISIPLYRVSLENDQSLSRKARDYLCEQLYEANQDMKKELERKTDAALSRRFARAMALSHFRSVYSASRELRKFPYSASERRKKIRGICSRYAGGHIRPSGLKSWIMAIPVYLRLAGSIDRLCSR